MKKALAIALMGVTAAVVTVIGFGGSPIGSMWERPQAEKAARGAYLVKIMGCNDCHTPWKMGANGPEPDMTRMLSGHPEWRSGTSATASAD